jgi:hypothetical protein
MGVRSSQPHPWVLRSLKVEKEKKKSMMAA